MRTIAEEAAEHALAGARPLKMNHYKVEIAKALVKRAILGLTFRGFNTAPIRPPQIAYRQCESSSIFLLLQWRLVSPF